MEWLPLGKTILNILICFVMEQNVNLKAGLAKAKLWNPKVKSPKLVKTVLCWPIAQLCMAWLDQQVNNREDFVRRKNS